MAVRNVWDTHLLPNLERIAEWAKAGATMKEVAQKLGIAYSTLRRYVDLGMGGDERYQALSGPFVRACEIADDHVEAALYKRACGFEYVETKREQKVDRSGNIVELVTTTNKVVPPDPTSAMFWLTNRQPGRWSYKPQEGPDGGGDDSGVVVLAPIMENPGPPSQDGGGGSG